MAAVIVVRGPSGSGKTTLIESVTLRLVGRGITVGVVKHTHNGYAIDRPGKDSQRFWEAGAQVVLAAGPEEWFLRQRLPAPPVGAAQAGGAWSRLSELQALLPRELDCVFIEGFSHSSGAADDAVAVRVEFVPEGVRLDGRVITSDEAPAAVEAAVIRCLT